MIPDYSTNVYQNYGTIHTWAVTVSASYQANMIVYDWSKLSFKDYKCVVKYIVPKVADYIAHVIHILHKKYGFKYNKYLIGGHGVGGHLTGLVSERLPRKLPICFGIIFIEISR